MNSLNNIRFVLVEPRNPNNIGAVARAMANFGLEDLRVVAPWEPTWKEVKSATLEKAIADVHLVIGTSTGKARKRGMKWLGVEPFLKQAKSAQKASKKIAILFFNSPQQPPRHQ